MIARREAVADALYRVQMKGHYKRPWEEIGPASPIKKRSYEVADAVLDAIDAADPTDAEVEAVARVAMGCPEPRPCAYCMDRSRNGLVAARKARP